MAVQWSFNGMPKCVEKDCKKTDIKGNGLCNTCYLRQYRKNNPEFVKRINACRRGRDQAKRDKGLCTDCPIPQKTGAITITYQDKKIVERHRHQYCWIHIKKKRPIYVAYSKKIAAKRGSCQICHGNKAKLCEECATR